MSGTYPPEPPDPLGVPDSTVPETDSDKLIPRTTPTPPPQRAALVKEIQADVRRSRQHWQPVFDRMLDDQNFAMGLQWPGSRLWAKHGTEEPYVVNVVLRHVQQMTATLYAKNPRVSAKVRPRILNTVWDGTFASLQQAMQALMLNPMDPMATQVVADAQNVKATEQLLQRMGKTLEIVYNYNIEEQVLPFKKMLKMTVRRAVVTGIGYVKVGFQRVTTRDPSGSRNVGDNREQMDTLQRLTSDIADDEIPLGSAQVEEARLVAQALAAIPEVIIREGLVFDYPDSNMIIPDTGCRHLPTFMGCRRVTEQFMLTSAQVQEIYGVDISKGYTSYKQVGTPTSQSSSRSDTDAAVSAYVEASIQGSQTSADAKQQTYACVWETYDRADGLVYATCDGYSDFLREPAAPDVRTERFWPWFCYLLNETYHQETPYPLSDVTLMRDMQMDINTAAQGLREHRHAARPKTITSSGSLDDEDKDKLQNHPANAVIELNGVAPGQKVGDVLQPWQGPGIDPNLYETQTAMTNILRVIGAQEANIGGTSGATATETSIAESSRVTSVDASMDDMDDLLSSIARTSSQILLLNVSTKIAQAIAGPGAVWPEASALEVAEELFLEVEAGSSGRPNQAKEMQVMQQMAPLLMQIPGINPEWLGRQMINRMDDRADMDDAIAAGAPSVMALNTLMRGAGAGPAGPPGANPAGAPGASNSGQSPPAAQGAHGMDNGTRPPGQGGVGPHAPQPRPGAGPPGPGVMTH